MATFTSASLVSGRLVGLLVIDYAGRSWRWSTRPVEVYDEDGVGQRFTGGLGNVELDEDLDLFGDSPTIDSIPFELAWPGDVARLVALGHDLGAAVGEFSLWVEGTAWEERVVLVEGEVTDPEYGGVGELVSFSLERLGDEDRGTVPEVDAAVKAGVTWDDSPDDSEGVPYPFVFGQPGPFGAPGGASDGSASPAIYVDDTLGKILVAGTPTETGAAGGNVAVYNEDLAERATLATKHARDGLGRTCTIIDTGVGTLYGRATDPWLPGHALWTVWTTGRGALCSHRKGAISGAGDLMIALLERSTRPFDRGAVMAALPFLNRFIVAGYADDGSSPYDWIAENLVPILPVSMATGPRGIYPIVWRYDATPEMAVAEIQAGRGAVRSGPVAYDARTSIVNELTLSYALRARLNEYARTRTLTGDPMREGEADVISSTQARQSWARYGRQAESITTDIVYGTDTADLVLGTQMMQRAFQRRAVEFQVDHRYDRLRRGDHVLVTDEDVHLSEQLGVVTGLGRGFGVRLARVTLLEDPVRDARLGQVSSG